MKKSVTNEINTLVSLKRGIKLSIIMKSMSASCSVAQSHPTLCKRYRLQCSRLPWHSVSPGVCSFMSIELLMLSNHLILCCLLLLLPSILPSIRVFSSESALWIRWPKNWSFSFSISPSNEYSGLISFRTDLFDLLAVQGTLKSLLQYHSSKASILWHSDFFIVQLSHPHLTLENHSFDYMNHCWQSDVSAF